MVPCTFTSASKMAGEIFMTSQTAYIKIPIFDMHYTVFYRENLFKELHYKDYYRPDK